jgi:hypothetical protein
MNAINGTIPNYLSSFGGLQFLDLSNARLSGSLPDLAPAVK